MTPSGRYLAMSIHPQSAAVEKDLDGPLPRDEQEQYDAVRRPRTRKTRHPIVVRRCCRPLRRAGQRPHRPRHTKLDVLNTSDEIRIWTGYLVDPVAHEYFPYDLSCSAAPRASTKPRLVENH
jgi:hypothetical protein